jgi:hypothetical protein
LKKSSPACDGWPEKAKLWRERDPAIKPIQPGVTLDLFDEKYTTRNRPVRDLVSFHEIGKKSPASIGKACWRTWPTHRWDRFNPAI